MKTTNMDLQKAYITQTTTERDGKSEWVVYSGNGDEMHRLPSTLDEKQAMGIIHFGRKFELKALDEGIAHERECNKEELEKYRKQIKVLADENIRLSNMLNKLIISEN